MTSKQCPNCGQLWTSSDGLAGWAERQDHQHLYECRNPSCTVHEYLEYPPERVPEGGDE